MDSEKLPYPAIVRDGYFAETGGAGRGEQRLLKSPLKVMASRSIDAGVN